MFLIGIWLNTDLLDLVYFFNYLKSSIFEAFSISKAWNISSGQSQRFGACSQNSKVGMGTGRGWLLSRWMCRWLVTQLHWSGWLEKALGWSWRPARRLCSPSACPSRHASCSPSLWQRAAACCGCSLCQWALEIQRERPHPSHLFRSDNCTTAAATVAAVDCLSSLSVGHHRCNAEVLQWFNFWSKKNCSLKYDYTA